MNNYVVRLIMYIAGYEKQAVTCVQAASCDEAGTLALIGECHNDPEWDDDSKQSCWDDAMIYVVAGVDEVNDAEYEVLCKHINYLPASHKIDELLSKGV